MSRTLCWLTCLIVVVGIAAGMLACGKVGGTQWIVGWNVWYANAPVSKDGRYLYFTFDKHISPTGGAWGRRWISPKLRGRIDLSSGQVDTGQWLTGFHLFGGGGLLIADTLSTILMSDSITGRPGLTNEIRITGYGDGRFLLLIRRPKYNPLQLTTFLLDNRDSYRVIGTGFREGWISTDEKSVVLVREDTGDTWIYGIGDRQLRKLGVDVPSPSYFRGLKDLPLESQRRASDAMHVFPPDEVYSYYPEEEERI